MYGKFMARYFAGMTLLFMLSFPLHSSAQNLVINPDFDNDLSGWDDMFLHVDAYWDQEDADNDLQSGSVNIIKSGSGAEIIVFQCVPVEPDTVYSFGAFFKLFTTDGAAYDATIILYPKSSENCGGAPDGPAGVANVSMTGSWIMTSSTITTPSTAQRIDFRVIASNGVNESVHIAADKVWLIRNDIFLNMVFDDGFE